MKFFSFTIVLVAISCHHTMGQLDYLLPEFTTKLDSIDLSIGSRDTIPSQALDRINKSEAIALSRIDSATKSMNQFVDTLSLRNLNITSYQHKLDSLYEIIRSKTFNSFTSKGDSLSVRVQGAANAFTKRVEKQKSFLDSLRVLGMGQKVFDKVLKSKVPKLPAVGEKFLDFSLPTITTGIITEDLSTVGLVSKYFSLPSTPKNLLRVPAGDLKGAEKNAGVVKNYSQRLKQEAGVLDIRKLPEIVEKKVTDLKIVTPVKKTIQEADGLTGNLKALGTLKDGDGIKKEGIGGVKRILVDQFAGKTKEIKSGMEQLSKYQKKYHSLADTRKLPKRPTTSLTGRPFVERLIPGVSFQLDKISPEWTGLNFSPYIGYQFSDRFKAHVGGTYRACIDIQGMEYNKLDNGIGFRAFANYKVVGNASVHIEGEIMKYSILSKVTTGYKLDNQGRCKSINFGISRTFALTKRFDWNIQILYNVLALRHLTFEQSTFRFGAQYKLKKAQPNN
ncbi:MAG: hypothetical protein WKF87_18235 [Chryseolinea sp.]